MELSPEMWKLIASQGVWALLFVLLLVYVLKQNAKREERLMTCLEGLTGSYKDLSKDVTDLKDDVKELKGRSG